MAGLAAELQSMKEKLAGGGDVKSAVDLALRVLMDVVATPSLAAELSKVAAEKAAAEKAEAEKKAKEEAAAKKAKEEAEQKAKEAAEKEKKTKEEAEKKAAADKAAAEKKATEEAEKKAKEEAEKTAAAKPAEKPAAAAGEPVAAGSEAHYEAVNERVACRKKPSTSGEACGTIKKGVQLWGTPHTVDGLTWVKLNTKKSTQVLLTTGTTEAWILTDGTSMGLPVLLKELGVIQRMTKQEISLLVKKLEINHADQEKGDGKMWVVTGGIGKGGIGVRAGQELKSQQYPTKLAPGTLIEQMAKKGNRLHYKRIKGDGPDFGWVSIEANEKYLVEPYEEDA